ncbi:MAG: von Willebrand factor type A domain-containing protein [Vicinamibacterales bacterium]
MKARPALTLVLCSLILTPLLVLAQQQTAIPSGEIRGIVRDTAGSPIPGATVQALQGGSVVQQTVSAPDGTFAFRGLKPGTVTMAVMLAGFVPEQRTVTLVAERGLSEAFTLQIGALSETVAVKSGNMVIAPQAAAAPRVEALSGRGGSAGFAAAHPVRQYPYPYNRESYAHVERNGFRLVKHEPLSTFSADVDTASYANVRRFLHDGRLPPQGAVRIEEMINYFRFDYDAPSKGPIALTTEFGGCPWAPKHKLVLLGLRTTHVDADALPARNLVFLLDVSGSMQPADKLPLVKSGMRMFVDTLRPIDRVAIVTYAGTSGLTLPSTPASNKERMHQAIEALRASGSTNGGSGIRLAYQIAREQFVKGGVNRVILATDGDFNVGVSSENELVKLIEEERKSGVFLSVLGVGTGNLQDSKMELLADKGNGNYSYLDSLLEARRVLVNEAASTLHTVAKDVKIQIEFNPNEVAAYRLIGYENRLLKNEDFNDDTKDAGEMGAGHTVTALYEIVPKGVEPPAVDGDRPVVDPLVYQTERIDTPRARAGELLTFSIRYKQPDGDKSEIIRTAARANRTDAKHLPFASAVAEFAMLLRGDLEAEPSRWHGVAQRAHAARGTDDGGYRSELARMIELAAGLKPIATTQRLR